MEEQEYMEEELLDPPLELYTKHEELGNGSCGTVSRWVLNDGVISNCDSLPGQLAVKEIQNNEDNRDRIKAFKLAHGNIIRHYGLELYQNNFHLKMELANCNLGQLKDKLMKNRYTFKEFRHMALHIMEGLSYLHSQNIAHRDMKPENIMVLWDPRLESIDSVQMVTLKIGDFDLSRYIPQSSATLSKTGTRNYMAPELLKAITDNYAFKEDYMLCDVFSTGLIFLVLLFDAEIIHRLKLNSLMGKIERILKEEWMSHFKISLLLQNMLQWNQKRREKSCHLLLLLKDDLSPILSRADEDKFDKSVAEHLLKLSREEKFIDPYQQKKLVKACMNGYYQNALELIEDKGARADMPDDRGRVPLKEACANLNINLVELLIDNNANVNCTKGLYVQLDKEQKIATPLYIASQFGCEDVVRFLIKHGADVKGSGALYPAILNFHHSIVKILIDKGADVNQTFNSHPVLHHAISLYSPTRDLGAIDLLLEAGSDIEALNGFGSTPLQFACSYKKYVPAEMLLKKGADVNKRTDQYEAPLIIACKLDGTGLDWTIVELLIKNGADVNAPDTKGRSPLHLPICNGSFCKEALELLVNGGADLNARDPDGSTLLHKVCNTRWNEDIAQLIIQPSADLNLKDPQGMTALHLAYQSRNKGVVGLLIKGGADVNAGDKDGRTILHMACASNDKEIIELLLDEGANVLAKNSKGLTPVDVVYSDEIRQLLLGSKDDVKAKRQKCK